MRRVIVVILYVALILIVISFQPFSSTLHAQSATPGLIDYLGAQATANVVATQAAYQQQQSAASAAQSAAAQAAVAAQAQAQAAAAQAQAWAQAQQATSIAQQQQVALAAQHATVDAAILQATVIAQETRTALEISAQETRTALEISAQETRTALEISAQQTREAQSSLATQSAWEATRSAVALQATAERRDASAVSTLVYGSVQATRESQAAQVMRSTTLSNGVVVVFVAIVLAALVVLARWLGRQWRNLAPREPVSPLWPSGSSVTSMAALSIIDGQTGEVLRVGPIEMNTDKRRMADLERAFHGHH